MYWNTNPATSVHLESLLNKKDVTLQEIMDDEGVLQECKSQNKRLIDYLIRSDVLEKLVSLTTEEPSGDEEDLVKYKYPNIACELLTSEVPQLSESLANDEALLRKLYSFLDSDAPLNPLLASFFSKTLSVLITRNSERNWYSYQFTCLKVLEFLKLKENSITLLLKHIGTSAIKDLIFKLITEVEGSDMKDNILNWLDEQKLVESLVALLDPSMDSDVHYNAAELLCDVIRTTRAKKAEAPQPDKILERIESPEVVSLLLDFILKEPKCETSIVGGISVLLTLLEDKCGSGGQYGYEECTQSDVDYLKVVASTTKAILPRLKDFHDILINPPLKPAVKTTITVIDPPLGITRVEVAKLLSVLVASNNEEINKELAELDTINVLLDLFFKYTWNNFLHTQVQNCLAFALNSKCDTEDGELQKNGLIAHILSKCHLIQRILDAWQDNETQQTEHKRPRRGYMGHLINIANNIVERSKSHSFGALMKETVDNETLIKWENFVSTTLAEIDETYSTCLGGGHPSANDKEGGEGKDGSYGNFSQVLYSNYYQLQALAPPFSGDFGSFRKGTSIDELKEDIKLMRAAVDFINSKDFNIKEFMENSFQEAGFLEEVCAQKFQTLDDYNEQAWNQDSAEAKENDNPEKNWHALESSSSDEEDLEPVKRSLNVEKDDGPVEYDMLSGWPEDGGVPPAQSLNPWESPNVNAVSSPDMGWANFDSAPFVPDFGLNLASDLNTTIATSASFDIHTTPLDLTPSESNPNVEKMFGGEAESEMEKPDIAESMPTSIEYTDMDIITKATEEVSLETKTEGKPETETGDAGKEVVAAVVNCVENPEVIGDVNSVEKLNEEKENFRFPSSQGLMINNEREPESGDSYQLLKENVQAVPNETAQASNKEVESGNPEDKSANGPI